jgi:hypothetical protein
MSIDRDTVELYLKRNRRNRRVACVRVTFFTTNPTWANPGSKPGLHGKRSANKSQNHVTASGVIIVYEFKFLK